MNETNNYQKLITMKKITFLATALLMSLGSFAQQALFDNVPVVSHQR